MSRLHTYRNNFNFAEQVTEDLPMGLIYAPHRKIRDASLQVAERVAASIYEKRLALVKRPDDVYSE